MKMPLNPRESGGAAPTIDEIKAGAGDEDRHNE